MQKRPGSLWRNADFVRLWTGQTISFLGGQVSELALPLMAVLTLHATAEQMALFTGAFSGSAIVVALFAGAWVDRVRRRRLLIASELSAALLIATIPVASALGFSSMNQLYLVAVTFGLLGPLWWSSVSAYLPSLVDRTELLAANSRLSASLSVTSIVGPGLAGLLVQALSAPVAIIADALSFAISAVLIWSIRRPEPIRASTRTGTTIWAEILDGLRLTRSQPLLRAIVVSRVILSFFGGMVVATYVLYVVRELGLEPVSLGVVSAFGAAGFLAGSLLTPGIALRFGSRRAAFTGGLLLAVSPFFILIAPHEAQRALPPLVIAAVLGGAGDFMLFGNLGSVRQAVVQPGVIGRVVATDRFVWSLARLPGAIVGGSVATQLGLGPALLIASVGHALIPVAVVLTPFRAVEPDGRGATGERGDA